jgi:hypothetical protein
MLADGYEEGAHIGGAPRHGSRRSGRFTTSEATHASDGVDHLFDGAMR